MDLSKKRVSFSHIIVPKNLRTTSDASSSSGSTSFSLEQIEPEQDEVVDQYSVGQPRPPPPTFKTLQAVRIPLAGQSGSSPNEAVFTDINLNASTAAPLPSINANNRVAALKFLETRRRSHAFSVSAIDETLPVNMDGEDYEYDEDDNEEAGQTGDGRGNGNGGRASGAKVINASKQEKYFRAAEIPIGGANRILICQTKNELIDRKSFQHEVRAIRDIDWFLARPSLLLDCEGNSVESVLEQMLEVGLVAAEAIPALMTLELSSTTFSSFTRPCPRMCSTRHGHSYTLPTMPPFSCRT